MNIVIKQLFGQDPYLITALRFYASKMQASSTQNTKDSAGRRLGYLWFQYRLKKFGNQEVMPNDIIARQRGFKWKPGNNIIIGKDHTIHSACEGIVKFRKGKFRRNHYNFIDV